MNTFNLKRFLMLFKKHSYEKGKEYILSILTITIIQIVLFIYAAYMNASGLKENYQQVFFIVGILLCGMIFTSIIFSDLNDKRKATSYLTLPASHLEKYLVNWLFSYLIFQLVFISVFYIATYAVLSLGINEFGAGNKAINIFNKENQIYIVFYVYLLVHSLILYGAIFFKKKHFIKIILTLFILGLALTFINKLLLTIMIDENVMTEPPFTNLRFLNENKFYSIQIVESTLFTTSLLAAIVILLWLSSFYRLKEKEV